MIVLLLVGLFLCGCAGAKNEFCEPCEQAARAGVDYRKTLAEAQARNERGLSGLFRVADKLDGAGSEIYSSDIRQLLESYGDTAFSTRLSKETKKVREAVVDSLDFAFEVYAHHTKWSHIFPETYRLGSHDREKRARAYYRRHPELGVRAD